MMNMVQKKMTDYPNKSSPEKPEILKLNSKDYPSLLKRIEDAPEILYAKGDTSLLNKSSVAIVGTRKPTKEGRLAANKIAKFYGKKGYVIVSGLAQGVDSLSMKAALKIGAPVIGVLPSPLNNIVPKKNEKLAMEILEKGGLLISEYPEGNSVQKYHFIQRNRIISGISLSTVVVETSIKGGTMHTVNFAKKQKRIIVVADIPTEGNQKLKEESIPTFNSIQG